VKKFFGLIMCLVLLGATVSPALAQRPRNRSANSCSSNYGRYERRNRNNYGYRQNRNNYGYSQSRSNYGYRQNNRSFWNKHRDKLTVAIGTGSGAVIGGLAGGKKGAIIGALLGAGGSALYTYKLRDRKKNRYYRRY